MSKQAITTNKAPGAGGPYSQAIVANGFVFTAGQIPNDPATGNLVPGGIEEQTRQCLKNVQAVLEAAGSSLDKVVKTTVFLQYIEDFAAMNKIYVEFFPNTPPARSTVQVANLPKRGALVEIETIALV
jgi:2-iminobutanoate/2-iminopropanoate deaminase